MHGSTAGAGFMDRVTGHDFYLELVREDASSTSERVSTSPSRPSLTLLSAILDNRWREFGSDLHKTVGIGEWAPRGAQTYQESLRRIGERGWLYHQHLISANEIQAHLDAFEAYRRCQSPLANTGRVALEPRSRRRHYRGAGTTGQPPRYRHRPASVALPHFQWRRSGLPHDSRRGDGAGRRRLGRGPRGTAQPLVRDVLPDHRAAQRRCTRRPEAARILADRSAADVVRAAAGLVHQGGQTAWWNYARSFWGSRRFERRRFRPNSSTRRQVPQHDVPRDDHHWRQDRSRHWRAGLIEDARPKSVVRAVPLFFSV